ncbi:MAG: hypothetical protein ACYDB2_08455 [Acidimicrobiales bacterium]
MQTVVVVTGTVVGTDDDVPDFVVGVEELPAPVVLVVGGVVDVYPSSPSVAELSSVDHEVFVVVAVVGGTVTGVVTTGVATTGFATPAKYITATPEITPEPTRRDWVRRRTRANRRSRCWGVRVAGVIRFPLTTVLLVILKS